MPSRTHIVDNRVFLLGLDELYRTAMKRHESNELLLCARAVAGKLGLTAMNVPVEGYYTESPRLTEYFKLMRTLHSANASGRPLVSDMKEYRRLSEVTSAPLFGRVEETGRLLPRCCDPLCKALKNSIPHWRLDDLVSRANGIAIEQDDMSLVGLAARIKDPVVMAATRGSVVLYPILVMLGIKIPQQARYTWKVDPDLAQTARRFVDLFNSLFDENLPLPEPSNAEEYWKAFEKADIVGRCVRLGIDDRDVSIKHYHWAVIKGPDGELTVHEFWDNRLWTTSEFRRRPYVAQTTPD